MGKLFWSVLVMVVVVAMAGCGGGGGKPHSAAPSSSAKSQPSTVPTVLILDASGSMNQTDAPGPRIDAAKNAAQGLVNGLPDDATIGLMTYGTGTGSSDAEQAAGCQDVKTLIPLGRLDRGQMHSAIFGLHASGYTPISLALRTAVSELPTDGSRQAIVLVSDGEDTCGSPPCDEAQQAKQSHPGLAISTVGFRTEAEANDQLSCIASATGGLFVQAQNASQLAARLLATQNVEQAQSSMSGNGIYGITLGSKLADIRSANPDFPATSAAGGVTVVYRDCDFSFMDGVLDSIAPHSGGRTIDGVAAGSNVSDAVKFYGGPLGTPQTEGALQWLVFTADEAAKTAFRMAVEGYSVTGTNYSGTIRRIVLCKCLPEAAPAAPVASFDGYGALKIGMTQAEATAAMGPAPSNEFYHCIVLGENAIDVLKVWIAESSSRVTGIETPHGVMTDRGVGDGSTPDQIRAAYSGPEYTIEEGNVGGQGMSAINVFEGPKDDTNHRLLGFAIGNDGRASPPSIGRRKDSESC